MTQRHGMQITPGFPLLGPRRTLVVPLLLSGVLAILLIAKSATIPAPQDLEFLDHRSLSNLKTRTTRKQSSSQNNRDKIVRHTNHVPSLNEIDLHSKHDNDAQNRDRMSICFITCQFSSTSDRTDHLYDVRKTTPLLYKSPLYHFFAFSNLPDLKAPGWEVVVKDLSEYKRWITQSRWAKFLAFRDDKIKDRCRVVFYIDGILSPRDDPELFQAEARTIVESEVQLAQRLHPYGGGAEAEFGRIRLKKKDLKKNIDKSLEWLRDRTDYDKNCTLYENNMFGYAIDSVAFQKAANFFWDHYSKEEGSWRDQPLWCYTLDHFDITPLQLTGNGKDVLFDQVDSRTAKGSHTYRSESVVSAATYYEAMKHMVPLDKACWLDTNKRASNSSSKPIEIRRGTVLAPLCPDEYRRAMGPVKRSSRGLTISIPYFARPALLLQQLTNFATYPKEIQQGLSIVIVDNGSPSGLRAMDHLNISTDNDVSSRYLNMNHTGPPIMYHFALSVVRINYTIDWNEEGSHNLAFYLSRTRLGLILDLRMLVPIETIRDALSWETTKANMDAHGSQSVAHKFNRRRQNGEVEHQQTCALVEVDEYWNSGGMDEDFAGSYGYGTSPHFWYNWEQSGRAVEKHDSSFLLEQETKACDPSWLFSLEKVKECRDARSNMEDPSKEGKVNRKLWKQKKSGEISWANAYLRFNWTVDF